VRGHFLPLSSVGARLLETAAAAGCSLSPRPRIGPGRLPLFPLSHTGTWQWVDALHASRLASPLPPPPAPEAKRAEAKDRLHP